MGLLCDYFAAESDADAAATASWSGGPSRAPERKQGLFRKAAAPSAPFRTVSLPGIEPVVMMATLEEALTGASADDALDANADGQVGSHGGVMVFRLRSELVEALSTATDEKLRDAAGPWSETEEFFGDGDPDLLYSASRQLADLARDARSTGQAIYCWLSP